MWLSHLPAVFHLKPHRGEYTQPGDSSCPQASLSIRNPGARWAFGLAELFASADPLFLSWLLCYQWPGFLPAVPRFLIIARRSYSSDSFPLRGPVEIALEHLCSADGWRWSFSPHLPCTSISNHYRLLIARKRVCTLWFFNHCPWQQYSTMF